ncbi:MAG: transposase [Treponema sp.]|jgi:hypothetical protein|nr:transposase [Treponema sp.]
MEEWVRQMNAADSGAGRMTVIEKMRDHFYISTAKAYKMLKDAGWSSGRKRRKDAGCTSLGDEELRLIANMQKTSKRKNGKVTMPVTVARSILQSQGLDVNVSNSRIRELLRNEQFSAKDLKASTPYQRMRSEYPNQIHLTDPSNCLLYFSPNGKQKIVDDHEHYKNKNFYEDGKLKCLRYVLTDHYSASICVRYYEAAGETALNMYNFLLYAWGMKDDPLYVFHGLPEILVWDSGSGNTAHAVTTALGALRVKTTSHLPGNPRGKGQVENANNIVETQFESRLRFEPVNSLDELNAAAERWCAAYNANMLPHQNTRLNRNGIASSRLMLWQKIHPEQLKELPDLEICRQIYSTKIEDRKVAGDLAISFVHPKTKRSMRYSLAHLPGIMVGQNVNVQPILVDTEPLIIVSYKFDGEPLSFECEPIAYDVAGFDVDAPVFGKEYKRLPDTIREKNVKELEKQTDGTVPLAFTDRGKGLKAHSYINAASPFIKQSTGEQIVVMQADSPLPDAGNSQTAGTVRTHEILISATEMAKRIKPELGFVPDGFIERLKAAYPEGVPSNLLNDLVKEYREPEGQPSVKILKFA